MTHSLIVALLSILLLGWPHHAQGGSLPAGSQPASHVVSPNDGATPSSTSGGGPGH